MEKYQIKPIDVAENVVQVYECMLMIVETPPSIHFDKQYAT